MKGFNALCMVCGLLVISNLAISQHDNVWTMGDGLGLDFNNGDPVIFSTSFPGSEANASVCNEEGSLLFYTSGNYVWNRDHQLMPNGERILNMPYPFESSHQGAVIVPMPGTTERFYIFSVMSFETGSEFGRLYYSVVDMRRNGGLGDVDPTQKGVAVNDSLFFAEGIAAVRGESCNYWLLLRSRIGGDMYAFEVTELGLRETPVVSAFNQFMTLIHCGIRVSPDRRKVAFTDNNYRLVDFDPRTGRASNLRSLLERPDPALMIKYHPEFSPDGRRLYGYDPVSDSLCQFDISLPSANAIYASKIGVADNQGSNGMKLKLGPDGKIYCIRAGNIDKIDLPDLPGQACGFAETPLKDIRAPWGFSNHVPQFYHYDTVVTVYHIEGGCLSSGILLSAGEDSVGWGFLWNNDSTTSSIRVDRPGTYFVKYRTQPCAFRIDSFHVRFPNGVLPTIHTLPACRDQHNGSAFVSSYPEDSANYEYSWIRDGDTLAVSDTFTEAPSGNYLLHIKSGPGCDTLLPFQIPGYDFRVSFTVSDTVICLGEEIHFSNTSDTHFTHFRWKLDNEMSFVSESPPEFRYLESGRYRVSLSGVGAICTDTAARYILVDQPPVPEFQMSRSAICEGQLVAFFPWSDSTTTQLKWAVDDVIQTESGPRACYQRAFDRSGMYPVTLNIHSRACPDTSYTDSIIVYPLPEVDLGSDGSICLHGAPVYLKNLREAPSGPYHQEWSTGDTTDILKVLHPGIYSLNVTTEPIGCTTTEKIEIRKDCYLDIPNAFTPNGDGHNDYFFPRQLLSENISRFHMQVVNRWGQTVFETVLPSGRGWDGQLNGKPQPTGVYLYRIEADFANGQHEQYEGNVTLIR